jgi:hypothetical protein
MPDPTPQARPTRLQILVRTTKFSVFPQPARQSGRISSWHNISSATFGTGHACRQAKKVRMFFFEKKNQKTFALSESRQ